MRSLCVQRQARTNPLLCTHIQLLNNSKLCHSKLNSPSTKPLCGYSGGFLLLHRSLLAEAGRMRNSSPSKSLKIEIMDGDEFRGLGKLLTLGSCFPIRSHLKSLRG